MRPSGNLLIIVLILAISSIFLYFIKGIEPLWQLLGGIIAGLILLDFYLGNKTPNIEYKRKVKSSIPVGVKSKVEFEFKNNSNSKIELIFFDYYPNGFRCEKMPFKLVLQPYKINKSYYNFFPDQRGEHKFSGTDLIILSPLKFWWKKFYIDKKDTLKVYPNFQEVKKYRLLATDNSLSRLGIKKRQKRGEGSDFHQLREYRAGDSFRQIDWNTTSKYLKLISKDYQDERDQQILFLIDCGRRMRHQDDNYNHMDQVLNSMLLLSYVALRQEDSVGFLTFGGINRWFPPSKTPGTIKEILNQTYDINPTNHASDYLLAAKKAAGFQKKRSLIIILTNTRDEDYDDLLSSIKILKRQHLVILADLKEKVLDETLRQDIDSIDSAIRFSSVLSYLDNRRKNHKAMSHQGIIIIDIHADKLPAALVNQYLLIKSRGNL